MLSRVIHRVGRLSRQVRQAYRFRALRQRWGNTFPDDVTIADTAELRACHLGPESRVAAHASLWTSP